MKNTNDPDVLPAVAYIENKIDFIPEIAFVLGSGLGSFADEVKDATIIPTKDVPGYPESTVPGHAGRLVCGTIDGVKVIVVQGRVHFYEGYPIHKVVFPVRLVAALGVKCFVVTNASGCLGKHLQIGDLMAIKDHVNLMGVNPLVGQKWGFDLFPDMSNAYDTELREVMKKTAVANDIILKEGVLGAWSGPTYETAAEIKFLNAIGVDAACMSTVPEVIAAARLKLRVVGVSCLTNYATGVAEKPHSHEEVVKVAGEAEGKFRRLLRNAVKNLAEAL